MSFVSKSTLLAAIALMVLAMGTQDLNAQSECHTCTDRWVGPMVEDWEHEFVLDHCGMIGTSGDAGIQTVGEHCSLCGYMSSCHEDPWPGVCHVTCDEECNPHVDPDCDVNVLAWDGVQLSTEQFLGRLNATLANQGSDGADEGDIDYRIRALAEAVGDVDALSFDASTGSLRFEGCGDRLLAVWELSGPLLGDLRRHLASEE